MTDALELAELLMQDTDEEVQRGVGAMLLEATRLRADRVVEFLQEWKGRCPQLILQIAATKLQSNQRSQILN